jgi:hypothetical protein
MNNERMPEQVVTARVDGIRKEKDHGKSEETCLR